MFVRESKTNQVCNCVASSGSAMMYIEPCQHVPAFPKKSTWVSRNSSIIHFIFQSLISMKERGSKSSNTIFLLFISWYPRARCPTYKRKFRQIRFSSHSRSRSSSLSTTCADARSWNSLSSWINSRGRSHKEQWPSWLPQLLGHQSRMHAPSNEIPPTSSIGCDHGNLT